MSGSTLEDCQRFLAAVKNLIDDPHHSVLLNPSGCAGEQIMPSPTNLSITPMVVDISSNLQSLALEPFEIEVLKTEFDHSLAILTDNWTDVPVQPYNHPQAPERLRSYSSAIQSLYESEVLSLKRKFLAQIEALQHEGSPDSVIAATGGLDCDDSSSVVSSDDLTSSDPDDNSEHEEQCSELERYYLILERIFLSGIRHPTREQKAVMAAKWSVSPRSIAVWFQNRRDREDDDIMAEIDFAARLHIGVEDEGDWSDEGEVPWDSLEDFNNDDDEIPDLPVIESGAAPYRIPSLSHSVATESDSSASRFPSPVNTLGVPSPPFKSNDFPGACPTTPEVPPQTPSLPSISAFIPSTTPQSQNSSLVEGPGHQSLVHISASFASKDMPSSIMDTRQDWLPKASRCSLTHTPPSNTCEAPGQTLSSDLCSPFTFQPSNASSSIFPPFPFKFTSPSSSSPVLRPSFSASTRASTPTRSSPCSLDEISEPPVAPTTPNVFSDSLRAPIMHSASSSDLPVGPPIHEEIDRPAADTLRITTFKFDFSPPCLIQPCDTYPNVFGTSHIEPTEATLKSREAKSPAVGGEQLCEGVEDTGAGLSKELGLPAPKDITRSVSCTEIHESEIGRIIFFPSAQDLSENEMNVSTTFEQPSLNRPLASFEDAVQLHFLATAAALVDDRQHAGARRCGRELIDTVAEASPKTNPGRVSDDDEPLMGVLPPMESHTRVEGAAALAMAIPEHVPLPPSPCLQPSHPVSVTEPADGHFPTSPHTPGKVSALLLESSTIPCHSPSARHPSGTFGNPTEIPLPPSPRPSTPSLSEDCFDGLRFSPSSSSDASSPPCPLTPREIDNTLAEDARPIVIFPPINTFQCSDPAIPQPLSLQEPSLLDLSWGSDLHSALSNTRELSPFEEFMSSSLIFQTPPPKPNPEVQSLLDSILRNWSSPGLGHLS
ncbi:uncharacterized protein EI90DRAFT_3152013 [Cantharellus anzutake]|uniref:uncharacterized protein n=1 Tax=Cantharellus anzutake TaxID=1750568 RepID=UPI001902C358|nr:uncharacterized protein EI90DRAFT_3152013 [Cantharellus anzutake]KAF8338288.1 hypothetical protein EI90DRAFT_3152013 [Cantharellus anzutake]